MGGFDAQICAACGQRDAPARCSRCSTWFCGPECQRKAWPTHKLLCTKAVPGPPGSAEGPKTRSSAFEWGADSERLLWSVEKVEELDVDPQRVLRELKPGATQSDLLDALGTALGSSSQQPEVKKAAELLWQRCGWEPHARERHDYSLLHAIPNTSPTTHDWQVTRAPPAPEEAKQRPPSGSRHEPLLLGGSCPIIDAKGGFSSEVKSQLAEFLNPRAPRPCIIKNLPIFDRAVEKWSVDYLKEHMGDQLYHTFASTQEDRRFAYSFDCRNEGGYRPARIAEACKMTFKDFVKQQQCEDGKAYYLQTPVLRYEDGIVTSAKFDEQLEADLHTMNRRLVNEMAQMGSFGELSRNQLFVSFKDFLTASHYDQQHNLYLQLRGSKKFLLFDVTCAPALYTYPVHHSLDRKARVDLESLDPNQLEQWPRAKALAGRGIEAVLSQGDVLFLPMSWFHHVHSLGEENVSLNYWFYDSGKLFEPSKVQWPLSMISLLELSRHVEYLVAEQLGPSLVGHFISWWRGTGAGPADPLLRDRWRVVRNYLLRQLRKLQSPAEDFVLAMLDARRWKGLEQLEPLASGASQGLRDQHHVSELLGDLKELALGVFHCRMPAWAYRVLGRAIEKIEREKLRFFLECAEEVLGLLRDHTDWGAGAPPKRILFNKDEARKAPAAILRTLGELSDLAEAQEVRVTTVDNGFFANWLQVLDAAFFKDETASLEPDWVVTGQEREFNYGSPGTDVFHGLFQDLGSRSSPKPSHPSAPATSAQTTPGAVTHRFDVTHRFNFLLINVFRGHFLRGAPAAAARRRSRYAEVARRTFRPRPELLARRDAVLARRAPGAPLIGVHKRVDNPGTARMQLEQRMLQTESYIAAVQQVMSQYATSNGGCEPMVLLASDDDQAVAAFQDSFGDRLLCREAVKRSQGGINERKLPREVHGQEERLSLEDAQDCLIDALLLAECDAFVHADSNLTIAVGIMNPHSSAFHVRDLVDGSEAGVWPGYKRCGLPF